MHRLWYDLRAQALFESAFREDVTAIDKSLEDMIWRVASRLSELTGKPLTMSSPVLYAVMDGLFQKALLKFTDNQAEAIPELIAEVRRVLAVAT